MANALRQLVLHGPQGLPVVVADDQSSIVGWITGHDVLHALAERRDHPTGRSSPPSLAS